MVIVQGKNAIGVTVDSVMEVMEIQKEDVETTPDILTTADSDCVLGVAKRDNDLIILLDLLKVVSKKEIELVKAEPAQPETKKETQRKTKTPEQPPPSK